MALDEKKLREAGLPASLISLLISITKAADRASAAAAAAGDGGGSITWADINDKPATFPPSDHSHAPADITELQAAVEGWTVRTSDGVSRLISWSRYVACAAVAAALAARQARVRMAALPRM